MAAFLPIDCSPGMFVVFAAAQEMQFAPALSHGFLQHRTQQDRPGTLIAERRIEPGQIEQETIIIRKQGKATGCRAARDAKHPEAEHPASKELRC